MRNQKYAVKLTAEERQKVEKIVKSKSKKSTPECKKRAKILLCLDENGEMPLSASETSAKCQVHRESIYVLRKQFVLEGLDRVLYRKKRETPPVPAKVTGEVEAHIIATACSAVPEGRKAWTLKMIADKIVLDQTVDSISGETVRRVLKKRNSHRI